MTDKALISGLTWRSLDSQRDALGPLPVFILPDDTASLFRKTTREEKDTLHVVSLAIIADTEKAFREFLTLARGSKAKISSQEEGNFWVVPKNIENLVKWWKDARRNGSAKIGATISADKKKAKSAEGIAKIKDRWPLPSSEWSTAALLDEAGVSLNTAKAHLGKRPIAQYNYQGFLKRKLRRIQDAKGI